MHIYTHVMVVCVYVCLCVFVCVCVILLTVQVVVFEVLQQRIKTGLLSITLSVCLVTREDDFPLLALWVARHHFPFPFGPIMRPLDESLGLISFVVVVAAFFLFNGSASAIGGKLTFSIKCDCVCNGGMLMSMNSCHPYIPPLRVVPGPRSTSCRFQPDAASTDEIPQRPQYAP